MKLYEATVLYQGEREEWDIEANNEAEVRAYCLGRGAKVLAIKDTLFRSAR